MFYSQYIIMFLVWNVKSIQVKRLFFLYRIFIFQFSYSYNRIFLQKEQTDIFIEVIKRSFGNLTTSFTEALNDLVAPFFKAFYSVFNAVKAIKSGYASIRDT